MKVYSEDAYHSLHRLGVTADYTGFSYLIRAFQPCAGESKRPLLVAKWLYPNIAKQYGVNWKAVERNIHTIGRVIQDSNRPLLEDPARRKPSQKSRTAQLLAILHANLLPSGPSMDEEQEKFL